MSSRNLYLNILVRCCLLAASALLAGWLIFSRDSVMGAVIIFFLFLLQVIMLISYLNRTNRQIAFFFEAVKNEDSTLRFPVHTGNKAVNDLNSGLNRINDLIKTIRFELQEQEQYFQAILQHVSAGIIVYNEHGNIILSNEAARTLLSYESLTHVNQLMRIDKNLFSAIKELQPGEQKLVNFNSKNQARQLSVKSTQFKTARENLLLIAFQDIKNEMEVKELESWIKLIRVLTHEIMNSVAPITSLSQTILEYYTGLNGNLPSEKVINNTIKGLEVINERGAGLISFVENYRKLTRIPPPEKKPVSLEQLLDHTITLINVVPPENNIRITREVSPSSLQVLADKKQISQVLINLLKNSVEALKNSEGGMVTLRARLNEAGRTEVTVTDNGPGIPAELMDKIFIPFFTAKESGTGIGLSLSRQIMMLHGGSLKMESIPGKQTTAILEF
jgi:two-component system, NtrC family, nitrogen regulation sensor histidine kinase NtrY